MPYNVWFTDKRRRKQECQRLISGCHHEVNKNCVVLGYYAASSGKLLPTFRATNPSWILGPEYGADCPETSARNYHHSLRNSPDELSCQACLRLDFLPALASGTACLGFRMITPYFARFRVLRVVTIAAQSYVNLPTFRGNLLPSTLNMEAVIFYDTSATTTRLYCV
jgi:hypothetical protein